MKTLTLTVFVVAINSVVSWENIPAVPTNRRTQFYLLNDDGGYNYGYDTGDGLAAKQTSTADNQVEGFYTVQNAEGKLVNVKYTAGVQGFVPEIIPSGDSHQTKTSSSSWKSQQKPVKPLQQQILPPTRQSFSKSTTKSQSRDDTQINSDASYQISYNTGEHEREESSDAGGNVKGRYSYVDEAGQHDLSYIAGPNIGFQVTGGSLATPNGISAGATAKSSHQTKSSHGPSNSWKNANSGNAQSWSSMSSGQPNTDGAYSFAYETDDHSRAESSDASGNVQGRYSYSDEAGQHDLSYIAGADSGFVVTGGSLATPNGLGNSGGHSAKAHSSNAQSWKSQPAQPSKQWSPPAQQWSPPAQPTQKWSPPAQPTQQWSQPAISWNSVAASSPESSSDGSYSFSYDSGDQSRSEAANADGIVQGRYSYTDEAGQHDLSYTAGGDAGFVVTGGSLAEPTGSAGQAHSAKTQQPSWSQAPIVVGTGQTGVRGNNQRAQQDGSTYEFSYETEGQTRQESADGSGAVQGVYSVKTDGGHQQVRFSAGPGDSSSTRGNSGATSWSSSNNNAGSWSASPAATRTPAIANQVSEKKAIVFEPAPNQNRPYDTGPSVHPTFTIIAPSADQKNFDYGPQNAVILGFLPPQHASKFGYIYDTQQ